MVPCPPQPVSVRRWSNDPSAVRALSRRKICIEEFAAVREQASTARSEQEALAARVAQLEKELANLRQASLKQAGAKTPRRASRKSTITVSAKSAAPDREKNK